MHRIITALGTASVLLALTTTWPAVASRESSCGGVRDPEMVELLEFVRHMTLPLFASNRAALHLPFVDSSAVQPVKSDSVCRLAAMVINSERGNVDSSRTIYLIDFGGKAYWAKDPKIAAGEYVQTFILDSTLTRILAHAPH